MITLDEAQREFNIRYYHWAISEFEREIDESFPNLRLFEGGCIRETYRFMQQLSKCDQLVLARSLLKKSHCEAVKTLGEMCSDKEEALYNNLDVFRHDALMLKINSWKADPEASKSLSILGGL